MKRCWTTVAILALLPVLYVLSEAPLVRLTESEAPHGGAWNIYRPVDWLIDETPLDKPLMAWTRVWGCEDDFQFARLVRMLAE